MGVPVLIDSDQLNALNSKLDRVLAELDAMRRPTSKAIIPQLQSASNHNPAHDPS
jgi:hypothetical protein